MATLRPHPFVLVASNHGTLIVNRNDYRMVDTNRGYGVGYQILNTGSFDQQEVGFVTALLAARRAGFGDGVVAVDCGANIGVHTVEWAKNIHGWGRVIAFEAQERIYYALAGNIAINNCLNATAHWAAVGSESKQIRIPVPDYQVPSSFGSLELKQRQKNEFIGQQIDYSDAATQAIEQKTIDSLGLDRMDLIKIDVEGMELDVLEGARETNLRCKPVMVIEIIKTDAAAVNALLQEWGYQIFPLGINILAVHESDPTLSMLSLNDGNLSLNIRR
jgi:FkbM family methyltransferase